MVNTRSKSKSKRKEMAKPSAVETHPTVVTIDHQVSNENPKRCPEKTAPPLFPDLSSPFWTPIGKHSKQARTSSPIFRTAKRVLKEPLAKKSNLKIQEALTPIAKGETVCENPVSNHSLPNVSTGPSESNPVLYTLDDLDMQLISQFEDAPQPEERMPGQHQDDIDDDLDQVESNLDPAFAFVNGHKVMKEYGPLLSAIFGKYGDITREIEGRSPAIVSLFLERVCAIFEKLKEMKLSQATEKELKEMLYDVRLLESEKLRVGWLHEKLVYICETKKSLSDYLIIEEEGKRCEAVIANLRKNLVVEMAKHDKIKKRALEIKTKVDHVWTHSLVDGLL